MGVARSPDCEMRRPDKLSTSHERIDEQAIAQRNRDLSASGREINVLKDAILFAKCQRTKVNPCPRACDADILIPTR